MFCSGDPIRTVDQRPAILRRAWTPVLKCRYPRRRRRWQRERPLRPSAAADLVASRRRAGQRLVGQNERRSGSAYAVPERLLRSAHEISDNNSRRLAFDREREACVPRKRRSAFGSGWVSVPKGKRVRSRRRPVVDQATICGRVACLGSAKLACRSRMIVPRRPFARSPGPRGPDEFSPTGGNRRKEALTAGDIRPSCQRISSVTASGRSGTASPAAWAA